MSGRFLFGCFSDPPGDFLPSVTPSFSHKSFKIFVIIELTMVSFIKGILLMGMLGMLTAGCSRQIDLAKIVAKNIAPEGGSETVGD